MTKSWDDIREEACRLYLSGQTLSQVREQIEAKFNFKAAPRSYRSHFKRWGITKDAQLKELRESVSTSVVHSTIEQVDLHDYPNGVNDSERAHSLPTEAGSLETSTELLRQGFQGLHTNTLPRIADVFWTVGTTFRLESIYGELRIAAEFRRRTILEEQVFVDGRDNVLHYAATTDDSWTLSYLVEFMQTANKSVDVESSKHRTALEIAIHMGRRTTVKTLLDAKASVERFNPDGQQPLHFAISVVADSVICRLLLDYGANANTTLLRRPSSPMHLTLERFMQSRNDHEKDVLCGILQELIDHKAQIDFNGKRSQPLIKFIKAATELNSTSPSVRQQQTRPSSLLGCYLSADRNPLCWFPKYHCPAFECKSLAAFIFSHTPKSGLSAILIENSDMSRYGLDLVRVLLSPCSMRYSNAQDPSINELLGDVFDKMRAQHVHGSLPASLLRQVVDQTPRKKRLGFLGTLMNSGYVGELECMEALTWIVDISDSDFRLAFGELLLARIGDRMESLYKDFASQIFDRTPTRIHTLTADRQLHERIRDKSLGALGITPTQPGVDPVVQCVMHDFTKLLLENGMRTHNGTAAAIIYVATQLRQYYKLPDIPISRQLLLELQHLAPQNKHLRGVLEADMVDSPDSGFGDSPHQLTSDSSRL